MPATMLHRIVRWVRSPTLAAIAVGLLSAGTPSHARSLFWPESNFWSGDTQFRPKRPQKAVKPDPAKKQPSPEAAKGPLQIIVSIAEQRVSLYENGALIAQSPISTGVERHPTPLGVFSVISKQKWHRSNIYSGAPMPYMQRITWSGIALHAGDLPGYPASHGCIRLPKDFAIRLWHLTKRGTRVIIAREDVRPVEMASPQLFARQPKIASALPEAGSSPAVVANSVAAATTPAPLVPGPNGSAAASDSAAAGGAKVRKPAPISVFVSRQLSRLFVRSGFTPLFDVPVKIQNPADPLGTHVFSVVEAQNDDTALRWTVVSVPEKPAPAKQASPRSSGEPLLPDQAHTVLGRIDIPQDAVDRIAQLLTPGSSLIISDHGISHETGKDTDFIVLTR